MMSTQYLVLFFLIIGCVDVSFSTKIPSIISPCYRNDPNLNECILKEAKRISKQFLKGFPELGMPPLDPLELGNFKTSQNSFVINNFGTVLRGLKNAKILEFNFDSEKKSGSCRIFGNATFRGNYSIDGQVLTFPIKGAGKSYLKLIDYDMYLSWKRDLKKGNDGKEYLRVYDPKYNYTMNDAKVELTGLFNNDKELGATMNKLINDNWREIIKDIGPPSIKVISIKILEIFNIFFSAVPYDELFPIKN